MFITPYDSFTRPADTTQYTALDLVANDVDAADVVPLTFSISGMFAKGLTTGRIVGGDLEKSSGTTTVASFSLHLFTRTKTLSGGDNAAMAVNNYDGYIGNLLIDLSSSALDVVGTPLFKHGFASTPFHFEAETEELFGYLQAIGAYAPASEETFRVGLHIEA